MALSLQEQLKRVTAARETWQRLNMDIYKESPHPNPIAGVRAMERGTDVFYADPDGPDGWNTIPALDGYGAWYRAFQALDTHLTDANHAVLDRVIAATGQLLGDTAVLKRPDRKAPDTAEMHAYIAHKIEELKRTGEVFIISGFRSHFNITRIHHLNDGHFAHTRYDAGGEADTLREQRDGAGELREIVNSIEARLIQPNANIPRIIELEALQLFSPMVSREYMNAQLELDTMIEREPYRRAEAYRQRRGNCTTRSQRVMVNDLLDDQAASDRLRRFIVEHRQTPAEIGQLLITREAELHAAIAIEENKPHWFAYKSKAFGPSYRFSESFAPAERKVFQREMKEKYAIDVKWGTNDDKTVHAYVPVDDLESLKGVLRFMAAPDAIVSDITLPRRIAHPLANPPLPN